MENTYYLTIAVSAFFLTLCVPADCSVKKRDFCISRCAISDPSVAAKTANEPSSKLAIAITFALEGEKLLEEKHYDQARTLFEKSYILFKSMEESHRNLISGNYGTLLINLGYSIIQSTIHSSPNLDQLILGQNLVLEGIKDFNFYASFGEKYKTDIKPRLSGAYNVLGIASLYLYGEDNAKINFKKAISSNPNNENAKYNLQIILRKE